MPSRDNFLEKTLNNFADLIIHHGGHAHKNHALRRVNSVAPIQGEAWDYEFFGKNHMYCFDAKECSSQKIYVNSFLKNKSNFKQFINLSVIRALSDFYICGFVVFFVNFNVIRFFCVQSLNIFKSLTPDNGSNFDFQAIFKDCTNKEVSFHAPIPTLKT